MGEPSRRHCVRDGVMSEQPQRHHLLVRPGDKKSLCGKRWDRPEGNPHLLAAFVGKHRRGRGDEFLVCEECEELATAQGVKLDIT